MIEVFNHEYIAETQYTWPESMAKDGKIRLPKQWLHWAKLAGLKPAPHLEGQWRGFYMKGRGRNWRVNRYGFFEASCPTQYFDRWANSRGAETHELPKTRDEFLEVVNHLHAASASAR